jgi:hypothetical protein
MRTKNLIAVLALALLASIALGADEKVQAIQDGPDGFPTSFVFGGYDPGLTHTDAPDCTFKGCNDYMGPGCRPFSSWLIGGLTPGTGLRIQVGCSRVTFGQIADVNYCVCHCATGGALPTPCTTQRMAAPVNGKDGMQDGPDGFPTRKR